MAEALYSSILVNHRIVDLTRLLEAGIPTYPTHPKYFQMRWCSMGDPAEINQLVLGEHTGTHLDAPSHFGSPGAETETRSRIAARGLYRPLRKTQVRSVSEAQRHGDSRRYPGVGGCECRGCEG